MPGPSFLLVVFLLLVWTAGMRAQDAGGQLIAAATSGDLAAAKKLIEKGADVNAKGLYDQTPIFFAADRGHTEMVRLLLDKGANIEHKDSFYKMTALSRAAMKQRIEVIKLLLERGSSGAGDLVQQAVATDKPEMLKVALESGKATSRDLTGALSLAERTKRVQMADTLRAAGAQPLPPANFKVDEATLKSYAGMYVGGRGGTTEVELALEAGKLKARVGGMTFTLDATSNTEFRLAEQEMTSVEVKVKGGKATGLTLNPGSQEFVRKGEAK